MKRLSYYIRKLWEEVQLAQLKKLLKKEENGSKYDLVFIISAGRSGSTLLRKLMVENLQIHIPPESSMFIINSAKLYLKAKSWENAVNTTINEFIKLDLNKDWHLDLEKLQKILRCQKKSERNFKGLIHQFYKQQSEAANNMVNSFGDKSPIISLHLKWITAIYPNAKYIHLVRNPFDVTHSRMINFNENINMASSRWLWTIKEYDKYSNMVLFHEIRYRRLVNETSETINQLKKFIGVRKKADFKNQSVILADDNLMHHRKLHQKISFNTVNKESVFSSDELLYLSKRFKKWIDKLDTLK